MKRFETTFFLTIKDLYHKKKVFGAVALIAITVAAGWNYQQSEQASKSCDMMLRDVEALAGCEVSSTTILNTGRCVKEVNSSREVCVTSGDGPVCSGTI